MILNTEFWKDLKVLPRKNDARRKRIILIWRQKSRKNKYAQFTVDERKRFEKKNISNYQRS